MTAMEEIQKAFAPEETERHRLSEVFRDHLPKSPMERPSLRRHIMAMAGRMDGANMHATKRAG